MGLVVIPLQMKGFYNKKNLKKSGKDSFVVIPLQMKGFYNSQN